MKTIVAFFCIAASLACKPNRLPPLPPERDPTAESAPVTPWRAPPNVLTTELSKGAEGSGHTGHHHGGMQHDAVKADAPATPEPAPIEHSGAGHEPERPGGKP